MFGKVKRRLLSSFVCTAVAFTSLMTGYVGNAAVNTPDSPDTDGSGFSYQSFELYPNGEEAEQVVTLEGVMPEGAEAEAVDVSEEYDGVAAYDITITHGDDEYQPDEDRPVLVEITDPVIPDSENIELWHIRDDGEREQVFDFSVEEGKISFYATGFSVYEIVVDENVVPQENAGYGWQKITDISELIQYAESGTGLCIGHTAGYYFKNECQTSGPRRGILKTDRSDIPSNQASLYYFEKADESGTLYYIYCKDQQGNTQYVTNYLSTNKTYNNLLFTDSENKTAFTILDGDDDRWRIRADDNYYWNQQGGNGGIRFCSYQNEVGTDPNNYMNFWRFVPYPNDPYSLDGKTYGLMIHAGGSAGYGFMADESSNNMLMIDYVIKTDDESRKTYYVTDAVDITEWTFHYSTEDKYTISANVGSSEKYLQIDENGDFHFVDESEATPLKVTPGSGNNSGKIKLSSGDRTIFFDSTSHYFKTEISPDSDMWFDFVSMADMSSSDAVTYTAKKVGVSDVANGDSVIVYTRIWDNDQKRYDFYAINHDGSLVPCYERGDNIMWVDNKINTLMWDFTEYYWEGTTDPNYYYELYNPYSRKYIAPQINGQILSDSKIGINLPGRKEGEYYTTILAWDDPYYAYAGLKSDLANERVTTSAHSEADTFYFATISLPEPTLTKVDTLDNDQYGITLKMIDFPVQPDKDKKYYQNDFLGTGTSSSNTPTKGLLSTNLDYSNGYPTALRTNQSLSDMFSGANEVNHLFVESTYNSSGYFEFDSCQNFATLIQEDGSLGDNFIVYKELGTTDVQYKTTLSHGQFFPYDTIRAGVYSEKNPENLYTALANPNDSNAGVLPDSDPRKYEKLHTVGASPNYYNGMEMTAEMVQTPSGKDLWGHDIIFEFTGDDDFWLYVDGELVIDLGGIHSALPGTVNFSTGKVVVNGVESNLREIFESNYRTRNPSATGAEVSAYLAEYFDGDEIIFKDYTRHNVKIFYMERGAGASNLHMRFNLSYVTPGHVILKKEVTGSDDLDFNLVEYPYQIWYKTEDATHIEKLLTSDNQLINVTYQNSTQKVKYESMYTPPNSSNSYQAVYFIDPSKTAEIHFPSDTIEYKIIECGINSEVYNYVYINDSEITGHSIGNTNRKYYDSGWLKVAERPSVVFNNHVNPEGLRTLSIQKNLVDADGNTLTAEQDKTTFNYRLYLTNGMDDTLNLANMYKYRVKDASGNLCKWNVTDQKFESMNTADYSSLSESEKKLVTFETSMNGSISKIPAGYTVEVPNLPVGLEFKVEERESELPLGYELVEYKRESGTYIASEDGNPNTGWIRSNESPKMYVNNKRGWGLEAKKIWSDKDYTNSHDAIYTAVYAGDDLISDTVKQIAYPDTSVSYFFESLVSGKSFSEYKVYEVELVNPSVDTDGKVTYDSIKRVLYDGDLTVINAVPKSTSVSAPFSYEVDYDIGTPIDTATGNTDPAGNVRSDTITNVRSGGVVISLYDMQTKHALSNGTFTITHKDNEIGTFTSDSHGRITIFYDFDKKTLNTASEDYEYIITQIAAPTGYISLPEPVTFFIDDLDNVTISGNDNIWQDWNKPTQPGDQLIAYINVYNKPFELNAKKTDGDTGAPIPGAHFALYRSVSGIGGQTKDVNPIPGYSDLVSGADGLIPRIDNNLDAGTYYLSEIAPPEGYTGLSKDIIFNISQQGVLSIDPAGQQVKENDVNGVTVYSYNINVPNVLATHDYYFDIEKLIFVDQNVHSSDPEQKFVFKVERFDEKDTELDNVQEIFYVTVKCDNLLSSYPYSLNDTAKYSYNNGKVTIQYTGGPYTFNAAIYQGKQTVHVTQKGIYRISEMSDWSKTDYDFWVGSNIYTGNGTPISQGKNDGYVVFSVSDVKADQYEQETRDENGVVTYRPTASFTNTETEYAYRSAQAYAENTIKLK